QLRQIADLKKQGFNIDFAQTGLVQLAYNEATEQRFERLSGRDDLPADLFKMINPEEACKYLGEKVDRPCILIHQAGALSPASLCRALLDHPNIELRLSTPVIEISNKDTRPKLTLSEGDSLNVDALVLANGFQIAQFSKNTPITPVRGQTSSAQLTPDQYPNHALRHAGYLLGIPGNKQNVVFGASYVRGNSEQDLRTTETRQDLEILQRNLPKLAGCLTDIKPSHAGVRATTTDRWPIVGPLADADFYQREYADLYQGKQYKAYPAGHYQVGIYILSGLGSRGLTSAAYCANILAHIMLGNVPPAPDRVLQALHPARFLIRKLRKA
ncbi:MAG: FAD-dependent 5-carboxymethylaminomethyl-2-thiouridine(34) oxidoreductase MnmC, partial [Proteobacteria bacterium]|nr:FAD-dependent 5-carboxymethylaminomethyl-2-thiouridine(34) oxidoreductase MnmC [Pseudomonadota bacterium]